MLPKSEEQLKWPLSAGSTAPLPVPSLQGFGAHHVGRQLVPWQVLDILMLRVDDLCQLSPPDVFLKHPHGHPWVKV